MQYVCVFPSPQEIFNGWTDLYGSPNPLLGSGLPYDVVRVRCMRLPAV